MIDDEMNVKLVLESQMISRGHRGRYTTHF